jgi:hypothetical protein
MQNFDIKKTSRRCSRCDQELRAGDHFFSALIEVDGDLERFDYCTESCIESPENCIAWWRTSLPKLGPGKIYWAPRHVLLHYFEYLIERPEMADVAYVLALLLVQKKMLHLEEAIKSDDPDIILVSNRKEKRQFKIPVTDVSSEQVVEIQTELEQKLFVDRPPEESDLEEETAPADEPG